MTFGAGPDSSLRSSSSIIQHHGTTCANPKGALPVDVCCSFQNNNGCWCAGQHPAGHLASFARFALCIKGGLVWRRLKLECNYSQQAFRHFCLRSFGSSGFAYRQRLLSSPSPLSHLSCFRLGWMLPAAQVEKGGQHTAREVEEEKKQKKTAQPHSHSESIAFAGCLACLKSNLTPRANHSLFFSSPCTLSPHALT